MDSKEWGTFEDDLETILETSLSGSVERKIESMTRLVYTIGKERFGECEVRGLRTQDPVVTSNRREKEIQRIRAELRNLSKLYRRSTEEEKEGLAQLRGQLMERLKELRKIERIRKARREKTKKRAAFIRNPYKFTATVLEGRRSGRLKSPREEVEEHLKATHWDENRNTPLGTNERIQPVNRPDKPMNIREPTWKEIRDSEESKGSISTWAKWHPI